MDNYTCKERMMIVNFLEHLKLETDTYMNWHDDGEKMVIDEEVKAVPVDEIEYLIKKLKIIKFGEIKNSAGTKFKFKDRDAIFMIINFNENADDYYFINVKSATFNDSHKVNKCPDYTEVELINE